MNIDDTIKTIESAIPEETKYQEWQPIKDTLKLDDPPPFPVEALPPVLRDMAEGISLSRKVPVAMSATAVLAAVGAALAFVSFDKKKKEAAAIEQAERLRAEAEEKRAKFDEKQENLNQLVADLTQAGYVELAQKVNAKNEELRRQLKPIYKELPRCVFQGDENFSNLCVDENDQIVGLFDFNMSGTEVIANYLANNAFMGHFCYEDEILDKHTPKEVLQILLDAFRRSTALIREHYSFTEQEFSAYLLYGKIAMISAYWNASTFGEYLKQEKYKDKIAAIIELILDEDLS